MHRFCDDGMMKPAAELSHYSKFRCMRVKWNNGEKFPKFLSALYYTLLVPLVCCLGRVLDTIRDDLLIVLAMLTPTFPNLHRLTHTTWRHAFNPPSHNLINGVQSSTAIRKVCSKYIPDRCMGEIFSFLCVVPL